MVSLKAAGLADDRSRKTVTVVDFEATEELKLHLVELVEPFYVPDAEALPAATSELDGFFKKLEQLREAGASVAKAREELAGTIPATVAATSLEYLLTVDADSFGVVKNQALVALARLYGTGITESSPRSAVGSAGHLRPASPGDPHPGHRGQGHDRAREGEVVTGQTWWS